METGRGDAQAAEFCGGGRSGDGIEGGANAAELLCGQRADRHQHVFLAQDEVGGVEGGQLEAVAVGDGVGGAGLHAVSAENAAVVVDIVDLGVPLGRGDAMLFGVLRRFDVNSVRRTGCRTKEASDALLQAILIPLQHMCASEALLEPGTPHRALTVRIVLNLRGLQHFPEGDAHALGDGRDIPHNRHISSIR